MQKLFLVMCLFRKCRLQGLRSRQKHSLLFVNEDFGGERNAANGALWTDITKSVSVKNRYCLMSIT
ncbi:MAG: hypothetical protein PWQ06_2574 [Anaerophaga sp.]|jgi:hypothetical protein|nr:hypothetical protein [Anaerophaga sp.]